MTTNQTAQQRKAEFIERAHMDGIAVLYAGTWAKLANDTEEVWAQAAQKRVATQGPPVDPALARRMYIEQDNSPSRGE